MIRYEDVTIQNATAVLNTLPSRRGANVHPRASDKRKGEVVIQRGQVIGPSHVSMLASVGVSLVPVRRLPRVAVISTGDELVEVDEMPLPQQVRRSNTWAIASVLESMGAVVEMKHLRDETQEVQEAIKVLMDNNDVLILSGGVSMGKYDVIPEALKSLGFSEVFHKVKQRPGKPFWFGTHTGKNTVVFAFPGNPVSSFLCLYRYFLPWLRASSGAKATGGLFAALAEDVTFAPELQYFVPVKLVPASDGAIHAMPLAGNGSGDFSVLVEADGFMELPADRSEFRTGDVFPVWLFNNNIF